MSPRKAAAPSRESGESGEAQGSSVRIRLVFADEGTFHAETLVVSAARLYDYDRLIDLLREDPAITRKVYVDLKRLVSAVVLSDDG